MPRAKQKAPRRNERLYAPTAATEKLLFCGLTSEVRGRCHSACQITVARRSGPLDRIVRHRVRKVEYGACKPKQEVLLE